MRFWYNSNAIPLIGVLILLVGLVGLLWQSLSDATPVSILKVEAKRDDVVIAKGNHQNQPLPAPQEAPLAENEGIGVTGLGYALLSFGDGLKTELYQNGVLEAVTVEPEAELIRLRHTLGTIFNDFNADRTIAKRLMIETNAFSTDQTQLARIISTTATGTKFIVAREDDNPLVWIVALEAAGTDLATTITDDGQQIFSVPVTAGSAHWVAPIGPPSEPVPVNRQQVEQWLAGLRAGQLQPEIGDTIWQAANARINGQDFQGQGLTVIRRDTPFPIRLEGVQGRVDLILDPGRQSGNPVDEVPLEDCDGDGLPDVPVRDNELLEIDFRPTTARVRDVALSVFNRTDRFSGSLRVFDPARFEITDLFELLTVGPGQIQRFEPTSPDKIYHYAGLRMQDGCLLALELIPPTAPPPPTPVPPATDTPVPPALPTPTPLPTATPTPPEATPAGPLPTCPPPSGWVQYVVQTGDTLNRLAESTGTSVYDLMVASCLDSPNIQVGQEIYLPIEPATPTPTATPTTPTPTPEESPTTRPTPEIISCAPRSIEARAPEVSPGSEADINFACIGSFLRPDESGFRARLSGAGGTFELRVQGGTSTSFEALIPVDISFNPGLYDLIVTNANGRSAIKLRAFEVVAVTVTPERPDLQTSISGPPTARPGENIAGAMQLVYMNNGGATSGVFSGRIVISKDTIIGNEDDVSISDDQLSHAGLEPGEAYQVPLFYEAIPPDWPSGQAYIGIWIDYLNQVLEENEDNNTDFFEIEIGGPDLIISQFSGPPTAELGEDISKQISLSITNQGNSAAGGFRVRTVISSDPQIDIEDTPLGTDISLEGLGQGQTQPIFLPSQIIPENWEVGPAYLGAIVDVFDDTPESDETNNTASTPIRIIGLPDLMVSTLTVTSTIDTGREIVNNEIFIEIENRGFDDAGSFMVVWCPYENFSGCYSRLIVDGLARGQRIPLEDNFITFSEPDQFFAQVDSRNEVVESNEENNFCRRSDVNCAKYVPPFQ